HGMGMLHPAGPVANWTLPTYPGPYTVYVLISDGFGGYATGSMSVLVGVTQGTFPGQALVGDGAPTSGVYSNNSEPSSALGADPAPTPGPLLSLKDGSADESTATAYYQHVDPNGLRATLGAWWSHNGFDPNNGAAAGEIRTSYLNNNDLGSGRDMHVLRHADGTV